MKRAFRSSLLAHSRALEGEWQFNTTKFPGMASKKTILKGNVTIPTFDVIKLHTPVQHKLHNEESLMSVTTWLTMLDDRSYAFGDVDCPEYVLQYDFWITSGM